MVVGGLGAMERDSHGSWREGGERERELVALLWMEVVNW